MNINNKDEEEGSGGEREEVGEFEGIINRAIIADPEFANGEQMIPQHIRNGNLGNNSGKQVRPLIGTNTHQQPPVRPSHYRHPFLHPSF